MAYIHKDLDGLKATDREIKGPNTDAEWALLYSQYHDNDRDHTVESLRNLGQGIDGNPRPVQTQLLRRVIDRRAGLYHRPPTRFLVDERGEALGDDHAEQKAMLDVLEAAQYNLFWREVDSTLALLGNAVVRFYPSSHEGTVVPRLFAPHNVLRDPDPACPNILEHDRRFALKLAGGVYEYFERVDGGWFAYYVDDGGNVQGDQPFPETGGFVPYGMLPAMALYDRYPAGQVWIPPSMSRAAWVDMTNAGMNDIWALVRAEAHSLKVVATDDTSMVPKESGPGSVWVLPEDAQASVLSNQPKLRESLEALETAIRIWSISEDLPASEFDKSKQIVTGAARKIEEAPLANRRAARKLLAEKDERLAYERFRAVHNYHRDDRWGPTLAPQYRLSVAIQPMANPLDAAEAQDANERGIKLGTRSRVDAVMTEHDVGRPEALRIIAQVDKDLEDYPTPKAQEPPVMDVPGAANKPDEMDMVQGPEQD